MYSRYTIGEISQLLGITPQKIRYYEKKGILEPIYLEGSKYRYYTTWDFHILMRARYYIGLGFSLEETAQFLLKEKLETIEEDFQEQEKKIEDEILYKLQLLNQLRKNREAVIRYQESEMKFSFKMRPGIFRINTQKEYSLLEDNENKRVVNKISKKAPFLFSSAIFPKSCIEKGDKSFFFGFGIEEKFADLLKIEKNGMIEYYPPTLCVHTYVQSSSTKVLSYKLLDGTLKYLNENGFELAGDIITQIFFMASSKENREHFSWHEVWVPIK